MSFVISKKVKYYYYNEKGAKTIVSDEDIKVLENALKDIDGILGLKIGQGKASITYSPLKTDPLIFEDIFEKLGYKIIYKDISYD